MVSLLRVVKITIKVSISMKNKSKIINVVLVESDLGFLKKLSSSLKNCRDISVIGEYAYGGEAIDAISKTNPDVVLIELDLADIEGGHVIETIVAEKIGVDFVVYTDWDDDKHIFSAFQAGALGYLVKNSTSQDDVVNAVYEWAGGGAPMSPGIAKRVLSSFRRNNSAEPSRLSSLSERERQVLELITHGCSVKKAAYELSISYETARTHLKNIYKKLHVHTLVEATMLMKE